MSENFRLEQIILFFLLAIGITWLCWIPTLIISNMRNYFVPSVLTFNLIFEEGFQDSFHLIIFILNQAGIYGPFLAAILTLKVFNRKDDLKTLFKECINWKINPKWYVFILLIPLFINFGSLGLAALLMAEMSLTFNPGMGLSLILLMFLNNLITSGLEEPGWRGFAVPELVKRYPAYKSSIIVGLVWAIWHYPYVFYLNYFELNLGVFLTILAMLGFTVLTTFGSVIYSWLYLNTKSIFLLIIFHTLQNILPILILGGVIDPLGGFSTAIFTLIIIAVISKRYGEETLQGLTEKEFEEKEKKTAQ